MGLIDIDSSTAIALSAPSGPPRCSDEELAEAHVTAWQVLLDRIELDVMRGERNLKRGLEFRTDPWDVPEPGLGPIPPSLHERAVNIHQRQIALLDAMAERLHYTLRQQAVADINARDAGAAAYPVYVDVSV